MKTLIIIFLFIASFCYSQDFDIVKQNGKVTLTFSTEQDYETFKQKVIFLNADNLTKDSLINFVYLPEISELKSKDSTHKIIESNLYSIIKIDSVKESLLLHTAIESSKPDLFGGFYCGVKSSYYFDSLVTLANSLFDNLCFTGSAVLNIGSIQLRPSIEIPLSKNKSTGLNFEINYRL